MRKNIQYILRLLRGHSRSMAVLLLLGSLDVGLSLLVIWITRRLIDMATKGDGGSLWMTIAFLGGTFTLSVLIRGFQSLWTTRMQLAVRNRLSLHFFSSVLYAEWEKAQSFHSGDIMSRVDRDVEDMTALWTSSVPQFILTALKLSGAFCFLYAMEPNLALVLAGLIPIVLLLSKLYFKRMRLISLAMKNSWSQMRRYFQETIQNSEVVKAFGIEGLCKRELSGYQKQYVQATEKHSHFSFISKSILALGFAFGYLVTFSWGLFRLENGLITFGTMMAFLQLVNMIQGPALGLMGMVPDFVTAYTAAERLQELEQLPKEKKEAGILLPDVTAISFSDVSFSYQPDLPVLDCVTMHFEKGKIYGLAGATGCGKTTVIRLLLAFIQPDKGSLSLKNKEAVYPLTSGTRINFSYVPQDNCLFSGTVRDNFKVIKPDVTDDEIIRVLELAFAGFVWDMPEGLDTALKEQGKGLSGGQRQRLAIARALLHPGSILLLDEITSSLDEGTEIEIIRSLRKIANDKIILFVSHKQKVISACDVVYYLKG